MTFVDPEIAAIVAQLPPRGKIESIEQQRAGFAFGISAVHKSLEPQLPKEAEYSVKNHTVPVEGGEIRVRSVVPKGAEGETFPLLVWYHGGGWALGDIDMDDYYLRIISVKLRIVTLNVEYRLAPEFPFPIGFNDAYSGLKWAADNAQKLSASLSKGFIIGGASAGGNLSAAVSLQARDDPFFKQTPLTGQLLLIPATVHGKANVDKYRSELLSMEENKDAPLLDADTVEFLGKLIKVEPPEDPRFSVLLAPSHEGLPPAYLQISGADPLRDEGILYEKVLRNSGVKTKVEVYPGLPHGAHAWISIAKISQKFNDDTLEGIKWLLSQAM